MSIKFEKIPIIDGEDRVFFSDGTKDNLSKLKGNVSAIYQKMETLTNGFADALGTLRSFTNSVKVFLSSSFLIQNSHLFNGIACLKLINVVQTPLTLLAILSSGYGTAKAVFSGDIVETGKLGSAMTGNIGDFLITGATATDAILEAGVIFNQTGAAATAAAVGVVTTWITGIGAILLLGLAVSEMFSVGQDVRNLLKIRQAEQKGIPGHIFLNQEHNALFSKYLGKSDVDFKKLSETEHPKLYTLLRQRIKAKIVSRMLSILTISILVVAIGILILSGNPHLTSFGYVCLTAGFGLSLLSRITGAIVERSYQKRLQSFLISKSH